MDNIPCEKSSIKGKIILLTGGTGSFGQEFVKIILNEYDPKSLRIYDNRELAAVEMKRKFKDPRLRFLMGDVRDKKRLRRAMEGVDIAVHAAALKHITICEYNPIEAIRTNVEGAVNVIDTAIDSGIDRVMAISTDKAVYPVNIYGATKMVAEKLFVQGNSYSGERKTKFSCSRYGNVLASSGSVIPLFKEQREKGEITVTDERMTRFFITLEQGVRFVIGCIENMKGGEIFVPKMPSMKITSLAKLIAPEAKIKFIGIRPGEKINEVLITPEEARHARAFEDRFIIEPEFSFWDRNNFQSGNRLPEGFKYSSDNNKEWLSEEQMREILRSIEEK